jgi:hypothetical protein
MSGLPEVNESFIKENTKICLVPSSSKPKKGGPYSKAERQKRLDEVFKLHFMYGWPANKIADSMKVNRHTIESDIKLLWNKLGEQIFSPSWSAWIRRQLDRLEFQRTRLMEMLDKENDSDRKLSIERLILEIDNRIMHYTLNTFNDEIITWARVTKRVNDFAEQKKLGTRWYSPFELIEITPKQREKIDKILNEP